MADMIFLTGLAVKCKIGIFDWERKVKQKVLIDMEIPTNVAKAARKDRIEDATDYKKIAKHTLKFVNTSEFFLIETLAEKLAQSIIKKFGVRQIKLRVSKPGAVRFSQNVGIEIVRKKK